MRDVLERAGAQLDLLSVVEGVHARSYLAEGIPVGHGRGGRRPTTADRDLDPNAPQGYGSALQGLCFVDGGPTRSAGSVTVPGKGEDPRHPQARPNGGDGDLSRLLGGDAGAVVAGVDLDEHLELRAGDGSSQDHSPLG